MEDFSHHPLLYCAQVLLALVFAEAKITNGKDNTIKHSDSCFDIWFTLVSEKHFVKLCNTRKSDLSCS